ncbi:MAG: hypothetical protein Q9161_008708 [Pseudevernia consocians]
MSISSPHNMDSHDLPDPGAGTSINSSDRVRASHPHRPSGSPAEALTTADSSGSGDTRMLAPQARKEAVKRIQEAQEKRRISDKQEIERLIIDKSKEELQEALALSSHVGYKSGSQRLPTRSNNSSSFHARLCEKVMRFMANVHLKTGADIEPRMAFDLVAEAGGDEKLALDRYLLTNSPIASTTPGFVNSNRTPGPDWSNRSDHDRGHFPLSSGRFQLPPRTDVETKDQREEQKKRVEEVKKPEEGSEKKHGVFKRLFGVEKTGQVESAESSGEPKRQNQL